MTRPPKISFRELRSQLPYLPQTLKLVWNAAGTWTLAWLLLLLVQGILPLATVFLTKAVVDALVQALRSGGMAGAAAGGLVGRLHGRDLAARGGMQQSVAVAAGQPGGYGPGLCQRADSGQGRGSGPGFL